MVTTVIEITFLLCAHSVAGIFSSTLKYSKKATIVIWCVWAAAQFALLLLSEFVFKDKALQFFLGFIMALIGQYLIFFLTTKGRVAQRVFTMLTYSILFCIFMALFTMVKGTFPDMHPFLICLSNAVILFGVVFYFLRYVCTLCRTAAKNIVTGWAPLIFVNVVFMITVILSSVFPVRLTNFRDPSFVTFLFISVSIMAVYPVIFSSINSMSEAAAKREVEAQNKLFLAQIEAENAQIEADSQARHDRRHHNLVLLEFAKNNDIENVRKYLKNLVDGDSDIWGQGRHCENMTVGTVLNVYERRAKESGIAVNIIASVSREIEILPKDLVIIVANLFENAIHATSRLKGKDKFINITVKESAQRLLIKIENSCKDKMVFNESDYGIGIKSIIATAAKYDGMYDFTAENGIFTAKISLNLK